MTLKEIAVKQIDAMSEHLPMLCKVISAEELATISLNIMEEAYSKEELNLLTEWYKNPLMLQLVNKSGAVAAMAQQRISSLVKNRIDNMSDEERCELFEDFTQFGNQ